MSLQTTSALPSVTISSFKDRPRTQSQISTRRTSVGSQLTGRARIYRPSLGYRLSSISQDVLPSHREYVSRVVLEQRRNLDPSCGPFIPGYYSAQSARRSFGDVSSSRDSQSVSKQQKSLGGVLVGGLDYIPRGSDQAGQSFQAAKALPSDRNTKQVALPSSLVTFASFLPQETFQGGFLDCESQITGRLSGSEPVVDFTAKIDQPFSTVIQFQNKTPQQSPISSNVLPRRMCPVASPIFYDNLKAISVIALTTFLLVGVTLLILNAPRK
jgi:hypothetical protein